MLPLSIFIRWECLIWKVTGKLLAPLLSFLLLFLWVCLLAYWRGFGWVSQPNLILLPASAAQVLELNVDTTTACKILM